MRTGDVHAWSGPPLRQRLQEVLPRAHGELAEGLLRVRILTRCVRRDEEPPQLLVRERDLGKVVILLYDLVALLDLPGIGGDQFDRHADVSKDVLVAFEHPLGRRRILLLVGLDAFADLLEREGAASREHQGREVHQPFERVHPVDDSAGVRPVGAA